MIRSSLGRVVLAFALGLGAVACGSSKPGASTGAAGTGAGTAGGGGTTGVAGAVGGTIGAAGAAGSLATGGGGGTAVATCEQNPPPLHNSGTIVELAFETVFVDQPFVYGEPNTIPGGARVTPTNFRFYVSGVELVTSGGGSLAVDIVGDTSAPVPYGVHLYNGEDDTSHTLRVLAPSGSYAGVRFALGLSAPCNAGNPGGRSAPLSAASQMTWPVPLGYLFLRYESHVDAADAGSAAPPRSIHMGGDITDLKKPSATTIALEGALIVPATGTLKRTVRVFVDQIFVGATTDVPILPFFETAPEMADGERLRLNAPSLRLFGFAP
jgi:hypothetical protein